MVVSSSHGLALWILSGLAFHTHDLRGGGIHSVLSVIDVVPIFSQFCDFNSKPEDVCKVISDLQSDGQTYNSFGKPILIVLIYTLT